MDNQQYTRRNVVITFIIGFVAGATPFVFMKILPMMLHPDLYTVNGEHLTILLFGVILTGCIVGVITSLIFAGEFGQKDPKEVFVYALGIPAIMISTVSGLMTDFNAMQKISEVQVRATAEVLSSTPEKQNIPDVVTSPVSDATTTGATNGFLLGTAWAEEQKTARPAANTRTQFIVVIGTFGTKPEAENALNTFKKRNFKTDAYIPRNLGMVKTKAEPIQYLIIFNSYGNQADAQRASRLLKINDPDLNVRLMRSVAQ